MFSFLATTFVVSGTRAQGQRGREAERWVPFFFCFVLFEGVGMLLASLRGRGSSNRRAAEQQNSRTGGQERHRFLILTLGHTVTARPLTLPACPKTPGQHARTPQTRQKAVFRRHFNFFSQGPIRKGSEFFSSGTYFFRKAGASQPLGMPLTLQHRVGGGPEHKVGWAQPLGMLIERERQDLGDSRPKSSRVDKMGQTAERAVSRQSSRR